MGHYHDGIDADFQRTGSIANSGTVEAISVIWFLTPGLRAS
ncbi:conserved hypothetical protein (plasmid) [Shigella boydii CDC 3083-94]|uniref:Uncharacterized protein n=1 Tax=Shigella boydii serotype 18 (strain CDC 3083-94 / BS512) TaxID=344609 RepID=B2TSP1_SHIB3|nr:conserved hypothetical protein [Shigella boydii CDC 3083-94]